jgi:hypothetical protein
VSTHAIFCQVVASLLVSVVLLGFKLSALKRLVQVSQRRTELNVALASLQPKLEAEKLVIWLANVNHDGNERADRIAAMESATGRAIDSRENELLEKGSAMFSLFDGNSARVKQLEHSATILYSETKLDEATRLLLGRAAAMVRATPQEIVAYMLNYDSRHMHCDLDPAVFVRSEVLQHVNAHHTVIFLRGKLGHGLSERTFLNSVVAKRVAEDPPTYVLAAAPIEHHDRIGPKDETRAVRAENCRAFQLTEVAPGVTKLDYVCSLNLRGLIPQVITNKTAVPGQMHGAPRSSALNRHPHSHRALRPFSLHMHATCSCGGCQSAVIQLVEFNFLLAPQCHRRCNGISSKSGPLPSVTPRTAESLGTCSWISRTACQRIWPMQSASSRAGP